MKLKRAQDRLEALKKTSVGAKALADVTAEVGVSVRAVCLHRNTNTLGRMSGRGSRVLRWARQVVHFSFVERFEHNS